MRERDAHSSARRSSSRHVRYRAVPRANRIPAPSSRAYQQNPTRVEGADIVMQSSSNIGLSKHYARPNSRRFVRWDVDNGLRKAQTKGIEESTLCHTTIPP